MGFDTAEIAHQHYYKEKGMIRLPLDRYSIELLSIIDGKFRFEDAYGKIEQVKIIHAYANVISYDFLIENKIMSRRPKDLEDIRQLEMRRNNSNK